MPADVLFFDVLGEGDGAVYYGSERAPREDEPPRIFEIHAGARNPAKALRSQLLLDKLLLFARSAEEADDYDVYSKETYASIQAVRRAPQPPFELRWEYGTPGLPPTAAASRARADSAVARAPREVRRGHRRRAHRLRREREARCRVRLRRAQDAPRPLRHVGLISRARAHAAIVEARDRREARSSAEGRISRSRPRCAARRPRRRRAHAAPPARPTYARARAGSGGRASARARTRMPARASP